MSNNKYFEVNRATWNTKVDIHAKSEMYDLEAFKKGKLSLMPYEQKALGDVNGKSLLHLQCHFGQDTLSWSRIGARCVGVDLSDAGIKLAKELNNEMPASPVLNNPVLNNPMLNSPMLNSPMLNGPMLNNKPPSVEDFKKLGDMVSAMGELSKMMGTMNNISNPNLSKLEKKKSKK